MCSFLDTPFGNFSSIARDSIFFDSSKTSFTFTSESKSAFWISLISSFIRDSSTTPAFVNFLNAPLKAPERESKTIKSLTKKTNFLIKN